MGYPLRARLDGHVPIRAPAQASSSPHVLTRDEGKTVTTLPASVQAEIPRASPRGPRGLRASRARNSTPPGPGPSGTGVREDQGRASLRHVVGAVTVEVTANGVKRFRPAGPVADRGPSTSRPTWPSGERPPITPGAP